MYKIIVYQKALILTFNLQVFDYKITFVNSQHRQTNSRSYFVLKTGWKHYFFRSLIYKFQSDSDLVWYLSKSIYTVRILLWEAYSWQNPYFDINNLIVFSGGSVSKENLDLLFKMWGIRNPWIALLLKGSKKQFIIILSAIIISKLNNLLN